MWNLPEGVKINPCERNTGREKTYKFIRKGVFLYLGIDIFLLCNCLMFEEPWIRCRGGGSLEKIVNVLHWSRLCSAWKKLNVSGDENWHSWGDVMRTGIVAWLWSRLVTSVSEEKSLHIMFELFLKIQILQITLDFFSFRPIKFSFVTAKK